MQNLFDAWTKTWLSEAFKKWNIEHFLPHVTCPVLVIQGENDEYGSLLQVDAIASKVKGHAQKLIIPAVGHTPHREAAGEVLLAVQQFVSQLHLP